MSKTGVFELKTAPRQNVKVCRGVHIYQPDAERQLKHCLRVVQTISNIKHCFTNARQAKLAHDFEVFAKDLIEFHEWRIQHHQKGIVAEVEVLEAKGYEFDDNSQPGTISIDVRSAYLARLVDMLLSIDTFMVASAKLSLTGQYLAHDIHALNRKVLGVIRDINTTLQNIKAFLEKEFSVTSDPKHAKTMIDTVDFDAVRTEMETFYLAQRNRYTAAKENASKGDSSLVDKPNQSANIERGKNYSVDTTDAFEMAFTASK